MTLVDMIPNSIYDLTGRMFALGICLVLILSAIAAMPSGNIDVLDSFFDSKVFKIIASILFILLWGTVALFYVVLGVVIIIEWTFFEPFNSAISK